MLAARVSRGSKFLLLFLHTSSRQGRQAGMAHPIVHLYFGRLPCHLAVQSFSQHATHFDYDAQAPEPLIDHDVDWVQGRSPSGYDTYVPRALCFDTRAGCSGGADGAYAWTQDEGEDYEAALARQGTLAWGAPAAVVNQRNLQARQDDDHDYDSDDDDAVDDEAEQSALSTEAKAEGDQPDAGPSQHKPKAPRPQPKAWATYATFDFHSRSIVPLRAPGGAGELRALEEMGANAEPGEGATEMGAWETGVEIGMELDNQSSLIDDLLRPWTEACDTLQAFNVGTTSSDAFAGTSHWALQQIRDEYSKTPMLCWGAEGLGALGLAGDRFEHARRLRSINSALSLAHLSEAASLYIPLIAPTELHGDSIKKHRAAWLDPRTRAALFQPYLDTSLLSLRLRPSGGAESAATLLSRLNWRLDTPVAALRGCFPLLSASSATTKQPPLDPIDALLASRGYGARQERTRPLSREEQAARRAQTLREASVELSGLPAAGTAKAYAESIIARGPQAALEGEGLADAALAWSGVEEPLSHHLSTSVPYNLSTTFPPLTRQAGQGDSSISVLASLRTTPGTSRLLREARAALTAAIDGHAHLQAYGIAAQGSVGGRDGLRETRERLEDLLGAYEEGEGSSDVEDVGTDEEYEVEEWDLE